MGASFLSQRHRPHREILKAGDHILLKESAAVTGLRSAAIASREGAELEIVQFGSGEKLERSVDVSDVAHLLVDCDCDASAPCMQGKVAFAERCSVWLKLIGD